MKTRAELMRELAVAVHALESIESMTDTYRTTRDNDEDPRLVLLAKVAYAAHGALIEMEDARQRVERLAQMRENAQIAYSYNAHESINGMVVAYGMMLEDACKVMLSLVYRGMARG